MISYDSLVPYKKKKFEAVQKENHKHFGNQVNILAAKFGFRHLALEQL